MIIGVTGYGYSGASALLDLLKEFEGIQYVPFEFQIIQEPDGLLDLMNGLVKSKRRLYTNTVVNRFFNCINGYGCLNLSNYLNGKLGEISKNYINSLVELKWEGRSNYDPEDIRYTLDKRKFIFINKLVGTILKTFNHHIVWPPSKERFFAFLDEETFIQKTQQYVNNLLVEAGIDTAGTIILDQIFSSSDPLSGSEFFADDVLSIIVDRDPRDVYIMTNILYPERCRFMPNLGDVDKFIKYYKLLHHNKTNDNRVLYLRFEDLIYRYDKTVSYLEGLLKKQHILPKSYFKPELSINNTQMFNNYPNYKEDISKIECELADYLFDFEVVKNNVLFERQIEKPF